MAAKNSYPDNEYPVVPFTDSWGFLADVGLTLTPPYVSYNVVRDGSFGTGRDRFRVDYLNRSHALIESRFAMQLVSKRTGKPYYVAQKLAQATPLTQ